MKKKNHCVQCGKNMFFYGGFINGLGTPYICDDPSCPNYGILQLSAEQMPDEKLNKKDK